MEKITYEKLISYTDKELNELINDKEVTYDMLPKLNTEQYNKLFGDDLGAYFDSIYGVKFSKMFVEKFNLSPTREISDLKGYLNYLSENLNRIKESYKIDESNSRLIEQIGKNISDIMYDNTKLADDKAKDYLNYLAYNISKIEDELK